MDLFALVVKPNRRSKYIYLLPYLIFLNVKQRFASILILLSEVWVRLKCEHKLADVQYFNILP